jgi:uncharacterized membrane protein/mono/diheme cytochrome c family protein
MQDFVFFLGRFHVLALHLPIGIVVAAVALDWVARRERHRALARVAPFLWGAAAVSAVLTAVLGYLHFAEGSFTGPSADAHRFYGTVTAVASVLVWWRSARSPTAVDGLRLALGVILLGLVTVTGHYGGNLTHGATFLIEFAPAPVRALIGAAERRPPVTSVAAADPYLDVVQPLLEQRCGTCHNEDKRNGGFSVANYDFTLVGGDTGRAVVPGNVEASELFYRVSLPPDDEAFMPAEGKTPLTAAQVEIVRWWIERGAPRDTTVGALGSADDIEPLLAAELGLGGASAAAPVPPGAASADSQLVARLFAAGFLVRQRAESDAHLVVSVNSPGGALDDAAIAALAAAAPQVVDLNLSNAGLDDDGLAALGDLPAVTHLRLGRNRITDRGLAALGELPLLEHLNLYGNSGITDPGLDSLAGIASLRELYLWQTGVSAAGVERLRQQRPDLRVELGSDGVLAAVGERAETGARE